MTRRTISSCGIAAGMTCSVPLPDDRKVPAAVPRRISPAVDDLPDTEFPRKMINRVSPEPVPVTPAKLALFRAGSPGMGRMADRQIVMSRKAGQTVHDDLRGRLGVGVRGHSRTASPVSRAGCKANE
jgi:hypothetical protein